MQKVMIFYNEDHPQNDFVYFNLAVINIRKSNISKVLVRGSKGTGRSSTVGDEQ